MSSLRPFDSVADSVIGCVLSSSSPTSVASSEIHPGASSYCRSYDPESSSGTAEASKFAAESSVCICSSMPVSRLAGSGEGDGRGVVLLCRWIISTSITLRSLDGPALTCLNPNPIGLSIGPMETLEAVMLRDLDILRFLSQTSSSSSSLSNSSSSPGSASTFLVSRPKGVPVILTISWTESDFRAGLEVLSLVL